MAKNQDQKLLNLVNAAGFASMTWNGIAEAFRAFNPAIVSVCGALSGAGPASACLHV